MRTDETKRKIGEAVAARWKDSAYKARMRKAQQHNPFRQFFYGRTTGDVAQ